MELDLSKLQNSGMMGRKSETKSDMNHGKKNTSNYKNGNSNNNLSENNNLNQNNNWNKNNTQNNYHQTNNSNKNNNQNKYHQTNNSNKNNNQNKYLQCNNYNETNANHSQSYVGAPYNFIPFSNFVYEYEPEQLVGHATMKEDCITGELEYEITAETPIMVSQGVEKKDVPERFYRNLYGRFAIPGSTIRGLIRNNVQILGLSSMSDDMDDYALMYRNIANGMEKVRYASVLGAGTISLNGKNVSVLKNVKAGYIAKEDGKYVIYQTCVDAINDTFGSMNYYVLSERTIVSNYLSAKKSGKTFDYSYFEQNGKSILNHELYKDFWVEKDKKGRTHYKGIENKEYKPYYGKVSYALKGDRYIIGVGETGKYEQEGYVISTGSMKEKKAVYIIPKLDKSKEVIAIPEQDVNAFKIDFKKKENTIKKHKDFFALPEEGETKPVFYIYLAGRLYFGFTPRLRLFYDHTIKEGLNKKHKEGMLDYAKAMFGYSRNEGSYKSRVSFSDAVAVEETTEQAEVRLVLGEPKPTSYCDYIMPDENGNAVTYNNSAFRLRGVKQYWLKHDVVSGELTDNEKVQSKLQPLPKGTRFRGKVRFTNLTPDELGLLLWSIKLKETSHMNVGKAKAFGYGNISVKLLGVKQLNKELAYNGTNLCLNPWEEISPEPFIQLYKDTVNKTLAGKKIDELPHIKNFFTMKDAELIPEAEKTKFMTLKEYQGRNDKVLPLINSVAKKK